MPCRLKVGRIPYLNLLPFYRGQDLSLYGYIEAPPRQLGALVAMGEVEAAPLAVVDTWRWEDALKPLGSFGLACAGPVESVLVFSKRPLEALGEQAVNLTAESSTSASLLRVLLRQRYGLEAVKFEVGEVGGEAFLAIGDAALKLAARPPQSYPYVVDLGAEWMEWTGTPFVFARWVVRRNCNQEEVNKLEELLGAQLEYNLMHLNVLAQEDGLGLGPERVKRYLERFHYCLTDDDLRGAELFRGKVIGNGLDD